MEIIKLENANAVHKLVFSLESVIIDILNNSSITSNIRAANVMFTCNFDCNTMLKSDPNILKALLMNILDNAVKLRKSEDKNPIISIDINLLPDGTEITIKDKGTGISKDADLYVLDSLPNYNTDAQGLFLAKQYAEKLGGNIKLQSEENVGTTVSIILPS